SIPDLDTIAGAHALPNGTTLHYASHGTVTFAQIDGVWTEKSVDGTPINLSMITGDPDLLGQDIYSVAHPNTFYQFTVCYVTPACSAPFTGSIPFVVATGIFGNGYTGDIRSVGSSPSVPVSHSAFGWYSESNSKSYVALNWRACC
ncbi:MAG: hypothetical protein ACRECH_15330, partial [Nitrososphaerales archaeon]